MKLQKQANFLHLNLYALQYGISVVSTFKCPHYNQTQVSLRIDGVHRVVTIYMSSRFHSPLVHASAFI